MDPEPSQLWYSEPSSCYRLVVLSQSQPDRTNYRVLQGACWVGTFRGCGCGVRGGCPSIMLTRPAVCMLSHSCCVVSPKSVLCLSMLSRLDNRAHSPVPGHRSIKRHVHGFRPPTEGKTENRKLFPTLSSDPNCERCADVCFRAETPQASECAAA